MNAHAADKDALIEELERGIDQALAARDEARVEADFWREQALQNDNRREA